MAPIRRYIRFSKTSVLECRIYLDNPSIADTWLLNPRNPALPKIISRAKPLILRQIEEESQGFKEKGKKSAKIVKDVLEEDDYECSLWLDNTSMSSYFVLTSQKTFDQPKQGLGNSPNGASVPIMVEDDDDISISAIPEATSTRASKRRTRNTNSNDDESDAEEGASEREGDPDQIAEDSVPEDKKSMRLNTIYEGLSVHPSTLYLVVKKVG